MFLLYLTFMCGRFHRFHRQILASMHVLLPCAKAAWGNMHPAILHFLKVFAGADGVAVAGRRSATGLVALLRARGESWRASSQATLSPFYGLEVNAGT